MSAAALVRALRDPAAPVADWTGLVGAARAEQLLGSLAFRMAGREAPARVEAIFEAARRDAAQQRVQALWEAEMARRALAPLGVPMVLLKGTAFHAAGYQASEGRSVGDLDILVPLESLPAVEAALLEAGWERLKEAGGYDDEYYRRWMHELPPLIHKSRDRMIDVHHTILPQTARPKPDAAALLTDSILLENGLRILSPADMIVHAAAHLFADGDLAGGLRNLWDIDRLLREFAAEDFWQELDERARRHGLGPAVRRAVRLASDLYATPIPGAWRAWNGADALFRARMLARDGWGRASRPGLRFAFYLRGHWLRMPPLMLARHLWIKATRPV